MLLSKSEEHTNSKIEIFHNNYKSKYSVSKKFIDYIEKIGKLFSGFSNDIESIISKNNLLKDFQQSSIYPLLINFENYIKFQAKEFNKFSNFISREICETFKIMKATNDKIEDKAYKELTELNKALKKSKHKMKENYNSYNLKMKNLEKLITEEKSMKINNLSGNSDVKEKKKAINDLISECKIEENKYEKSVEDVNNNLDSIRKEEQIIIGIYKNFEGKRINKMKENVVILLESFKEVSVKLNSNIEGILQKIHNVEIEKDITDFDKFIKENYIPEINVKFIPYKPIANLDDNLKVKNNQSETKDISINLEIISIFQKNFKYIYKSIDISKEKHILELRNLCFRLFDRDQNINFLKDDLDNLLSFMDKVDYRDFFLLYLTNERTSGILCRSEKLINELSIILKYILNLAEKEKNYFEARNCLILGQTFYKEETIIKENDSTETKKIYLMEYFKNNEWIKSLNFWYNLIEMQIIQDKKKLAEENPTMDKTLMEKKLTNVYFSSIITYLHNMADFGIEKKDSLELCQNLIERYKISDEFKNVLNKYIEDSYDPNKKRIEEKQIEKCKKNKNNKSKKNNIEDDWVIFNDDIKNDKNDKISKDVDNDIMVDDFVITGYNNKINNNDININIMNDDININNENLNGENKNKNEDKEKEDTNKNEIKEDNDFNDFNNE